MVEQRILSLLTRAPVCVDCCSIVALSSRLDTATNDMYGRESLDNGVVIWPCAAPCNPSAKMAARARDEFDMQAHTLSHEKVICFQNSIICVTSKESNIIPGVSRFIN